ncbi:hypothetical protein N658DRAFT_183010 [Parathielavia hyrcaniae]|uniref:Uncharacterized protein n=1 Tax=Parathielavia hyrcaniae TaxID=113614 RepID=A0AAN6Q6S6_9PEZI|nr:hypothetical protein N658DRAFT_183010 [Parathielavia hyrcaniae]
MPSSVDRPFLEEPWPKRLRATPSRAIRAGREQLLLKHLPSPKPTNPSSNDNLPSSSSFSDQNPKKTKPNPVQSLRDRLVPLSKKPSPLSPVDGVAAHTKSTAKTSVAPFFQRIKAAFEDKQAATAELNHASTAERRPKADSSSPDAEDLIQQLKGPFLILPSPPAPPTALPITYHKPHPAQNKLKEKTDPPTTEHYLETATTLHQRATMHLAQAHSSLALRLTQTLAQPDAAFLDATEAQVRKLRGQQPLDRVSIRSQQRNTADGSVRTEEHTVAELMARAEQQVGEFEAEVCGGLWEEWAAAEREVEGLLRGLAGGSFLSSGGDDEGDDDEDKEVLRLFGERIEREIALAEEEAVELGEEAVAVMKEIEKEFRKATLPDLHTFFQSIDEP